jgi:hypothetical protein
MTNFFSTGCVQSAFPVLPVDVDCIPTPALSQVAGIVIMPIAAGSPADWTDAVSFLDSIDNSDTQDLKGKYFLGVGEIPEAEDITVTLGRGNIKVVRRRYSLLFSPAWFDDVHYSFFRNLQRGRLNFRFWIATYGGRLLGGPYGIMPSFVTAKMVYGRGNDDREVVNLNLQWFADVDPDRANVPDLFGIPKFYFPQQQAEVMFFQEIYYNHSGNTLGWTANNGVLPSNSAQIAVYQNGQRKLPAEYTINFNTAPGQSQFVISADSHYDGSNYQIVAVTIN